MKRKHIDAMREVRLWIGQVIIPAVGVTVAVMSHPEANAYIKKKAKQCKDFVNTKVQNFKQKRNGES